MSPTIYPYSTPTGIINLVPLDAYEQACRERHQPCADVERLQRERDDLKAVIDGQQPWNEKARQLLDVGRWAGRTYLEAAITELEEVRDERDQFRADVAELNERMTTEVKSYLASMAELRAENRALARLIRQQAKAFGIFPAGVGPFTEAKLGQVGGYTDAQLQEAIDEAFAPSVFALLSTIRGTHEFAIQQAARLAIARAFLAQLAAIQQPAKQFRDGFQGVGIYENEFGKFPLVQGPYLVTPNAAECGQCADNDSEFEDFERGIQTAKPQDNQ